MGLKETIESSCKIIETAKKENLKTRGYVAVAWECPFEGKVQESIVLDIANQMLGAGVDEIILADTIGAANPSSVSSLFNKCVSEFDHRILSAHFHDTRAMALANVCAALSEGIRKFDSCIGGLGGCPFAPGAAGNLVTEDLANMLSQMGYKTGVDLEKLPAIVNYCAERHIHEALHSNGTSCIRGDVHRSCGTPRSRGATFERDVTRTWDWQPLRGTSRS